MDASRRAWVQDWGAEAAAVVTPGASTSLRLAVTDRCNLRCEYCMPSRGVQLVAREGLLSLEELFTLVSWINARRPLGRVKITGGEPLVRRGLVDLIGRLAAMPGRPELSMTTNGTLLAEHARQLAEVGLSRVNVSLDCLAPQRYRELTRGGDLRRVLAGIEAARAAGLAPIKLNAVLRRSGWREDVPALLDFAAERGLELRFLELMRTGTERRWCEEQRVTAGEVLAWLEEDPRCRFVEGPELLHSSTGPARYGRLEWSGTLLDVGWILPVSRPFCDRCDRLRLDARGRLRRCLMDPQVLPLAELLARNDAAAAAMDAYLMGKRLPLVMDQALPMVQIGG